MTDGPTEARDLDKTERNKALVRNFVEDILVNGKMEKLAGYFDSDHYIHAFFHALGTMATGRRGEPVAPCILSGRPTKRNTYTWSLARSSRKRFSMI